MGTQSGARIAGWPWLARRRKQAGRVRQVDVAAHAGTAFDGQHLFQIAEDRIQKIDPETTTERLLDTLEDLDDVQHVKRGAAGGRACAGAKASAALARIGEVQPQEVLEPLAGPVWGYRRRARLGVRWVKRKGRVLVGFRERSSALLADLERCAVLAPPVGEESFGDTVTKPMRTHG